MITATIPSRKDTTVCLFFVPGLAIAQPRKTTLRHGPMAGRTIEAPAKHKIHDWKAVIRHAAKLAMEGRPAQGREVAIRLELSFVMPRPQDLLRPKWAETFLLHTKKPDLDNLEKAIKDALKMITWTDDCQVSTVIKRKAYTMPGESAGVRVGVFIDTPEPIPFWP